MKSKINLRTLVPIGLIIGAFIILLFTMAIPKWSKDLVPELVPAGTKEPNLSPPIITDTKKILLADRKKCLIILLNPDGSDVEGFPIDTGFHSLSIPTSSDVDGDGFDEIVVTGLTKDNRVVVTVIGQNGEDKLEYIIDDKYCRFFTDPVITNLYKDESQKIILFGAISAEGEEDEEFKFIIYAFKVTGIGLEEALNTPYILQNEKINDDSINGYLYAKYDIYGYNFVFQQDINSDGNAIIPTPIFSSLAVGPQLPSTEVKLEDAVGSLVDGLVAYYKFDDFDNHGKDNSLYGNNLESIGVNIVANDFDSKYGYAAEFINNKTFFKIEPDKQKALDIPRNNTVAAWVKISSPIKREVDIVRRGIIGQKYNNYWYYITKEGKLAVDIFYPVYPEKGPAKPAIESTESVPTDSWHHIAYVSDSEGLNVTFYLDGSPLGSSKKYFYTSPNTNDLLMLIGQYFIPSEKTSTISSSFIIDELAIWKRALSKEEICKMMEEGIPEEDLEKFKYKADGGLSIYFSIFTDVPKLFKFFKFYGISTYQDENGELRLGEINWSPIEEYGNEPNTPTVDHSNGDIFVLGNNLLRIITVEGENTKFIKVNPYLPAPSLKVFPNCKKIGNISLVDINKDGKLDVIIPSCDYEKDIWGCFPLFANMGAIKLDRNTLKELEPPISPGGDYLDGTYLEVIVAKLTSEGGTTPNAYILGGEIAFDEASKHIGITDYYEYGAGRAYASGDINGDSIVDIISVTNKGKIYVNSFDSTPPFKNPWPYWRWIPSLTSYKPELFLEPPSTDVQLEAGKEFNSYYTYNDRNKDDVLKHWVEGLPIGAENYFDDILCKWVIKWKPTENNVGVHNFKIKVQDSSSLTSEKEINITVIEAKKPDLVITSTKYEYKKYFGLKTYSIIAYVNDSNYPKSKITKSFSVKCKLFSSSPFYNLLIGSKVIVLPKETQFPQKVTFKLSLLQALLFNKYEIMVDADNKIKESNENNNSSGLLSK